ncbi:MAG: glycosyltransferase [Bacteroidetes bacterium]|nr:glycosyltransferase [Bacteroidota bacterium]
MAIKLSIVIPVYNEEENVPKLLSWIDSTLKNKSIPYEIILVNDGSTDNTWLELKQYAISNKQVKAINFYGNFGQSTAMMAGIDYASGEYIVTMDGDLQNDPEDIPMLLKLIEEGENDVIAGERLNRQDKALARKLPSKVANFLIRWLTGVRLRDYGCTLKIFRSDIAKDLGLYGELHRFIPVLARLQGARISQVPVKHHSRQFGKSKYGLNRTLRVASDLLLMIFMRKYLQRPMHLFGGVGIAIFFLGVVINLYLLGLKMAGHDIWGKPLLVLALLLTLGGIQFITIGIFSEVQMRTYYESQKKKTYKIKEIINE